MTTEAGLLDAIWHEPHDDGLRLIYADWLDDHGGEGERDRAELIRAQCELARLPGDDPRYDVLEERAKEILARREKGWWKAIPYGCRTGHFDRGFPVPYLDQIGLDELVRPGARHLTAAPLWRSSVRVQGTTLEPLLSWPLLHRMQRLDIIPPVPAGWVRRVAACSNLRNVSEVSLLGDLARSELGTLLDVWAERRLVELTFYSTAENAQALAKHPAVTRLRRLWLGISASWSDSFQASPTGGLLTALSCSRFNRSALDEDGLTHLLRWPGLCHLRELDLFHAGLTDAGVARLANTPAVANLRALRLSLSKIGKSGAVALIESPFLRRLKELRLSGNPVCRFSRVSARLRERFGDALRLY